MPITCVMPVQLRLEGPGRLALYSGAVNLTRVTRYSANKFGRAGEREQRSALGRPSGSNVMFAALIAALTVLQQVAPRLVRPRDDDHRCPLRNENRDSPRETAFAHANVSWKGSRSDSGSP